VQPCPFDFQKFMDDDYLQKKNMVKEKLGLPCTERLKNRFNLFAGKAKCSTCHFLSLFNGLAPPCFSETESVVSGLPKKTLRLLAAIQVSIFIPNPFFISLLIKTPH